MGADEKRSDNLIPWKSGQSGNPAGRPVGVRNRLSEDFLNKLHEEFQKHGEVVVEKVRQERPLEFLKIIASLVPKELTLNVALGNQLAEFLDSMRDVTPPPIVLDAELSEDSADDPCAGSNGQGRGTAA